MSLFCGHLEGDNAACRGTPWQSGPGKCRVCWLFHNTQAQVTWVKSLTPSPPVPAAPHPWPWAVRSVALLKREADTGVGDTLQRLIAVAGGERYKRLFKKVWGRSCGCADRQKALNQKYPYVV